MDSRLPKADIHVHLEGTITPALARKIAARNKKEISPALLGDSDDHFLWQEGATPKEALVSFLHAYDAATKVMSCAQDYTDITYDYLIRAAAEGCVYAEPVISADHGKMIGLTYVQMVEAIAKGYERAKAETGIEARFLSACVRHFGPEQALDVARVTRDNPHPLVTGFTMAGDENAHTVADFKPAFDLSGLPFRNAHAGEAAGPESVRAARDVLGIRRFGHMVRAVEDEKLMDELKKINAVPEVCVSSNMALKVFKSYKEHPLRRFFDYGLKVTLGSDDPSFFGTSIGREYQIAQDEFGFTDVELLRVTRNAVEEAFVGEDTRKKLLQSLA